MLSYYFHKFNLKLFVAKVIINCQCFQTHTNPLFIIEKLPKQKSQKNTDKNYCSNFSQENFIPKIKWLFFCFIHFPFPSSPFPVISLFLHLYFYNLLGLYIKKEKTLNQVKKKLNFPQQKTFYCCCFCCIYYICYSRKWWPPGRMINIWFGSKKLK